ncbi:MAG: hypothetical protein JWN49_582 [Parcubacteria group bacterium]|nr:hypothetical protein [Parcubacteria group bacterium]
MQRISEAIEKQIIELRKTGKSIPEISQLTRVGRTTVQRYVLNIEIPNQYVDLLREKQGGAKQRAEALRFNTLTSATLLLDNLSARDYLMLLVGIYWGEGTKRDFGIINSDPCLIQTFIVCLSHFGIGKERLLVQSLISLVGKDSYNKLLSG